MNCSDDEEEENFDSNLRKEILPASSMLKKCSLSLLTSHTRYNTKTVSRNARTRQSCGKHGKMSIQKITEAGRATQNKVISHYALQHYRS